MALHLPVIRLHSSIECHSACNGGAGGVAGVKVWAKAPEARSTSSPPTEGKGSNDVRENQWTTDHTAYGDSCMVDTSTIGHGNQSAPSVQPEKRCTSTRESHGARLVGDLGRMVMSADATRVGTRERASRGPEDARTPSVLGPEGIRACGEYSFNDIRGAEQSGDQLHEASPTASDRILRISEVSLKWAEEYTMGCSYLVISTLSIFGRIHSFPWTISTATHGAGTLRLASQGCMNLPVLWGWTQKSGDMVLECCGICAAEWTKEVNTSGATRFEIGAIFVTRGEQGCCITM
ncbi:hypothetical protein V8E55_006801 [Tylopilus felleus]